MKDPAAYPSIEVSRVAPEGSKLLMSIKERTERMLALTTLACVRPSAAKGLESFDHKASNSHLGKAVGRRGQDGTNIALLKTTIHRIRDCLAMLGVDVSTVVGDPVTVSEFWVSSGRLCEAHLTRYEGAV